MATRIIDTEYGRIELHLLRSERKLRKLADRMGVSTPPLEADARADSFSDGSADMVSAVTVRSDGYARLDAAQRHALLAHEAVHAAQARYETAGEERPGEESRACLVQRIVMELIEMEAELWPGLAEGGKR